MPPVPLPQAQLVGLHVRFQRLVDWGFAGNLTLAAKMLGMPFSTVQKYYQLGPRRVTADALMAIEQYVGRGLCRWFMTGDGPPPLDRRTTPRRASDTIARRSEM